MGNKPQQLTVAQILDWADAYRAATGAWPSAASRPIGCAPGEHWKKIDGALSRGSRGLPGGDSLARLLVRHGRRAKRWAKSGPGAWTAQQDDLVRTLSPAEAARKTGRPLGAIYKRRQRLRVPDGRRSTVERS
jgi:hypothetical protein